MLAAGGEHHREVAQDDAGVVDAAPLAHRRKASERASVSPMRSLSTGEQRGPGVGDHALSVRRHIYGEFAAFALHLQGETSWVGFDELATRRIPAQADEIAPWMTRGAVSS